MNWTLPGTNNTVEQTFWNTDEGMRSLFQNMSDFFTNSGQNYAMAQWFNQNFGAERNRYNVDAIQDKDLTFEKWLQGRAPHLANQFNLQPASLRGSQPGFTRPNRQLW